MGGGGGGGGEDEKEKEPPLKRRLTSESMQISWGSPMEFTPAASALASVHPMEVSQEEAAQQLCSNATVAPATLNDADVSMPDAIEVEEADGASRHGSNGSRSVHNSSDGSSAHGSTSAAGGEDATAEPRLKLCFTEEVGDQWRTKLSPAAEYVATSAAAAVATINHPIKDVTVGCTVKYRRSSAHGSTSAAGGEDATAEPRLKLCITEEVGDQWRTKLSPAAEYVATSSSAVVATINHPIKDVTVECTVKYRRV